MGLTLNEWGPSAWNMLHVVAHTFPRAPLDEDRQRMYDFLHLFALHLPCPSCREHFVELLKRNIPEPTSEAFRCRDSLVMFMNDAHNEVNRRLGKREFSLTEHYAVYRPQDHMVHHNTMCVIPCIVMIALAVMYLYNGSLKRSRFGGGIYRRTL